GQLRDRADRRPGLASGQPADRSAAADDGLRSRRPGRDVRRALVLDRVRLCNDERVRNADQGAHSEQALTRPAWSQPDRAPPLTGSAARETIDARGLDL